MSLIATAGSHCSERAEESLAVGESLLTSEIMGLAVMVVGEPRTTTFADAGVAHLHGDRFDVSYLERTLRPICELAEDMGPWNHLRRVADIVRS